MQAFGRNGQPLVPEKGTQYEAGDRTPGISGKADFVSGTVSLRSSNLSITNPGNPLPRFNLARWSRRASGSTRRQSRRAKAIGERFRWYADQLGQRQSDPACGNVKRNAPGHYLVTTRGLLLAAVESSGGSRLLFSGLAGRWWPWVCGRRVRSGICGLRSIFLNFRPRP